MKKKLSFLIAIMITTLVIQNGFAQVPSDIKIAFGNDQNTGQSDNNLRTGSCPVPVWDVKPAGKVVNCNSACVKLDVRDSSGTGAIGDFMQPASLFKIQKDGSTDVQNTLEVFINGNLFLRVGPANSSPGGGTPTLYYTWTMVGPPGNGLFQLWMNGDGFCPTTQVSYKWYDSGGDGSFPWVVWDPVSGVMLGSGMFMGVSAVGGLSTGPYTNWAGVSAYICPTCPVGALTQACANGIATFCPANAKPGKYGIQYTFTKNSLGPYPQCTNSYWDTITVNSIYNANWTSPGNVCIGGSYNLNTYLSGAATTGGTWSGTGVSGNTFTPIGSGPVNITYTVGGGTSCETTETHAINVVALPTVTITPSGPVSYCAGTTVNLTLTALGANTYVWANTGETTSAIVVSPSSVITYTVTGTSVQGCENTSSITVNFSSQPNPGILSQTNINCKGGTGTATVTASGGIPPFSYLWSNGQTTATATNLTAGTYSVTVTNGSCTPSGVELINNGNFNSGNTGFSSSYTYCNTAGCLNPEGYYAIGTNPGFFHSSFTGADHTTGTGDFLIVNGTGTPNSNVWCQTITVTPNTNYQFSTWVSSIFSSSPAELQFSINGVLLDSIFNAPSNPGTWLQFFSEWNSGSNTTANICIVNQNTTLGGNDFGLDDISFQACTPCSGSTTVTITEPSFVLSSTISSQTDINCKGENTGVATISASGGTAPYTYSWLSTGGTNSTAGNLIAGTYTVTVNDSNGCTTTATATITEPASLLSADVSSQTTASCGQSNGSATITATGGTSPYTYSWSPVGGTNAIASAIPSGNYVVTIVDSKLCMTTVALTINNANGPVASISSQTNPACAGGTGAASVTTTGGSGPYTYAWSSGLGTNPVQSNLTAGSYTVTVTDVTGCTGNKIVTITQPNPINIIMNLTNATCGNNNGSITASPSGGTGAFTYSWAPVSGTNPTLSGLSGGTYTVTVTDASGCTATRTAAITQSPAVTTSVSSTDASCGASDGTVSVTAGDGTGLFTYLWSPGGSTSSSTNNLAAGNYTITVTDVSTGCTATNTVTVNQSGAVSAGFTPSPTSGSSPLPVVFTNTSTGATIYKWFFGDGTIDTLMNPSHTYTKNGSYTVKLVVYNAAGCSDSITYIITVNDETIFCIPNIFTPNDDGSNDMFTLCGSGIASIEAAIYDRWGLKIYTWNTINGGWDGRTASGSPATEGTYYYIIKAIGFNDQEYAQSGFLMLLR